MKWIDITSDLSEQGRKGLKTGQVLMFSKIHLRIVRKAKGKVWAKRVFMYKPEEVEITDAKSK
jgi:hypothetical protein